jgi:hypothetical protein
MVAYESNRESRNEETGRGCYMYYFMHEGREQWYMAPSHCLVTHVMNSRGSNCFLWLSLQSG